MTADTTALPGLLRRVRSLQPDRVMALDVARGLALIGMMATHLVPDYDTAGRYSWAHEVFSGRASALFCVLAGVSLTLSTRKAGQVTHAAELGVVARAVLIGFLGLLLAQFSEGVAVILVSYAVLFVVGATCVRAPTWLLAALAASWWLVGPWLSHRIRASGVLPANTFQVPDFDSLDNLPGLVSEVLVTGYYPVLTWFAFLVVGMWLGRLDLRSTQLGMVLATVPWAAVGLTQAISSMAMAAFSYAPDTGQTYAELRFPPNMRVYGYMTVDQLMETGFYGVTPASHPAWLWTVAPHSGTPLEVLEVASLAAIIIGACCLLDQLARRHGFGWVRFVAWPVAAAGSITLTGYSVHVLLVQHWPEGVTAWLQQAALIVVAATAWSLTGWRGPLEQLLHWVSTWVRHAATPDQQPTSDGTPPPADSPAADEAAHDRATAGAPPEAASAGISATSNPSASEVPAGDASAGTNGGDSPGGDVAGSGQADESR